MPENCNCKHDLEARNSFYGDNGNGFPGIDGGIKRKGQVFFLFLSPQSIGEENLELLSA